MPEGVVAAKAGTMTATLHIVFDNERLPRFTRNDVRLQTAWGFACVVETPKNVFLFDTGSDAQILLSNMKEMGLDPARVESAVISHSHYDHAGGLAGFARKAPELAIYLPQGSFADASTQILRDYGARTLHGDNGQEIAPGFFLIHTESGGWREQSLAIRTAQTTVLITGCAHPGIVKIAANAAETLRAESLFTVGGFHLRGDDAALFKRIAGRLKKLGVEKIAPAHCTGETARRVLAAEFGAEFVPAALGSVITVR